LRSRHRNSGNSGFAELGFIGYRAARKTAVAAFN
jgi:hypothetical protein